MCHASSVSKRVSTARKRCRPALGTVFLCCVLALSAFFRSGVDAFATLTSTARRSLPALAPAETFDALGVKGPRGGRRGACDELLWMRTGRYDGACCWMSTTTLTGPREVSKVRLSACHIIEHYRCCSCRLQYSRAGAMLSVARCMLRVACQVLQIVCVRKVSKAADSSFLLFLSAPPRLKTFKAEAKAAAEPVCTRVLL